MRAAAQNFPGRTHGIAQPLYTTHSSGAQCGAVHNERIELYLSVSIQKAAASGVKSFVVFHDNHGFLDRVERRTAAVEYTPTRSHGVTHAAQMSFHHVVRDGPGATMNY